MKTMKTWRNIFVMCTALLSLASCSSDDVFDSMGEHPIECMQVMTEDEPGQWQNLYFSAVKGFTYERGHEYVLRVKRTILANPPQDASNRTYELVRILADKKVEEVAEPVEKEVKSEADIEYEQQCPIEKYAIAKGGEYLVDAEGKVTYADGTPTPEFDKHAQIYLENILDKIKQPTPTSFHRLPMRYALCRAIVLQSSSRTYLQKARWRTPSTR